MKISRSGLMPAITFRNVTPVEPIHGAAINTTKQNNAQGATILKNRAGERPPSSCGDDVAAAPVGPLEDHGGDFKDFIKMFRRQDVIGRSIGHKNSGSDGDHS